VHIPDPDLDDASGDDARRPCFHQSRGGSFPQFLEVWVFRAGVFVATALRTICSLKLREVVISWRRFDVDRATPFFSFTDDSAFGATGQGAFRHGFREVDIPLTAVGE
jgi:hypothetical protein